MKDFLTSIGIELSDLVSGFFGGVVNAFVFKKSDPWSIAGSIVVGTLTAAYFSEWVSRQFGFGRGTAGFVVGLCAMFICQGLVETVKIKVNNLAGNKVNDTDKVIRLTGDKEPPNAKL